VKNTKTLEEYLPEMNQLYPQGFRFIHDNNRVHQSLEPWAMENGYDILDFPTYSADLNSIENLWSALKSY